MAVTRLMNKWEDTLCGIAQKPAKDLRLVITNQKKSPKGHWLQSKRMPVLYNEQPQLL